jgi:hypothetical protein
VSAARYEARPIAALLAGVCGIGVWVLHRCLWRLNRFSEASPDRHIEFDGFWVLVVQAATIEFVLMCVVAAPVWLLLPHTGRSAPITASLLLPMSFSLIMTAATLIVFRSPDGGINWRALTPDLQVFSLAVLAGVLGLLMWRIAYRRVRTEVDAEVFS